MPYFFLRIVEYAGKLERKRLECLEARKLGGTEAVKLGGMEAGKLPGFILLRYCSLSKLMLIIMILLPQLS